MLWLNNYFDRTTHAARERVEGGVDVIQAEGVGDERFQVHAAIRHKWDCPSQI